MSNFWGFSWREQTKVTLLKDGGEYFPRIKQALELAQQFILFEMYLFESGHLATEFIDIFCEARARGVSVFLVLDGVGARKLKLSDRLRLERSGVQLVFYNPIKSDEIYRNFHRDHRKLIVVDDGKFFIGGAGITDDFDPRFAKDSTWREVMLEVEGHIALDARALFLRVWQAVTHTTIEFKESSFPLNEGYNARLMPSARVGREFIKSSVIKRVRTAEATVWLATAYFFPTRKLRRAIKGAARRGVDVRLLLPGVYTDHPGVRRVGHHLYQSLLAQGVRIYEYQPRFLHMKAVLCDDWASIGSCNLDRWNQKWNLDANLEVDDERFADVVYQMLKEDFSNAVEITPANWRKRPWYFRLLEVVSYRLVMLIERFMKDR